MKETKKTSGQKTTSKVKQPITLVDIHKHLESMEKSAERDSSFNQGLAVLAVGLGVALGVAAIGHAGLSTKAELGGWLILTGLVVAFIGGFMMLKASCRKKVK